MSRNPAREFDGRTALVTGGASGIGRAICTRLAAGGARIAMNYRTRDEEAAELVSSLRAGGAEVRAFKADLTDPDQVARMCCDAEDALGPIGLLVNNAGKYSHDASTDEVAHFKSILDANLLTAFVTTNVAAASMKKHKFGRIVNVASTAVRRVSPNTAAYAAAKAAVVTLTQAWAVAWGRSNIRVNCVMPGFIATASNAQVTPAVVERMLMETPLGRPGLPEEPAEAVAYLLSDAASFISGQCLAVCGGRTAP